MTGPVPATKEANAMALLQVAQNFARVGGPFIGGALLAWSLVGAAGTFLFIASIFIFVIAAFSRLPRSKPRRRSVKPAS